jgi:hypothetical protein
MPSLGVGTIVEQDDYSGQPSHPPQMNGQTGLLQESAKPLSRSGSDNL